MSGRTAHWVNNSDPYGYSPHDDHAKYQDRSAHMARPARDTYGPDESDSGHHRHRGHGSPKSRRSSRAPHNDHHDHARNDHHDHARNADRGRHHSPAHGSRSKSRKGSTVRNSHGHDNDESGWDTDYDPRDRYYLSGDDEAHRSEAHKHSHDQYKPRGDDHGRHNHQSSRDSHPGRHSGRQPLSRRVSSDSAARRQPSSRPRPARQHSSYSGRPRSARYPPNATRSRRVGRGLKATLGDGEAAGENDNAWETAMRSGMKAATIAALRVSSQKGSIYEKMPRVATAAIGAAMVDSFLTARHPGAKGGTRHAVIRQVAELAIGNLVAKPAARGLKQRRAG